MKRFLTMIITVITLFNVSTMFVGAVEGEIGDLSTEIETTSLVSESIDDGTEDTAEDTTEAVVTDVELTTEIQTTNLPEQTQETTQEQLFEIVKTTISLTEVYASKDVVIEFKHIETQNVYSVNFTKSAKYTNTVDLLPGEYQCVSIKTDNDSINLMCPESITVGNAEKFDLKIELTEKIKPVTLKDLFFDNILFLGILLVLVIILVVQKISLKQW